MSGRFIIGLQAASRDTYDKIIAFRNVYWYVLTEIKSIFQSYDINMH